jgi:hypothetical protein
VRIVPGSCQYLPRASACRLRMWRALLGTSFGAMPTKTMIPAAAPLREMLEQRRWRFTTAPESTSSTRCQRDAPNAPLGRELDDVSAVLAKVRAELARLDAR